MKKIPVDLKYKKSFTPRLSKLKGMKGTHLAYFSVGLRHTSNQYFTYEQLESARRAVSRLIKPKDKKNRRNQKIAASMKKVTRRKRRKKLSKRLLIIRSTIVNPLTKKPLQVRMGKGKGNVDSYAYISRGHRILLELSRKKFTLRKIKKFFDKASIKLPGKMRFVYSRHRREKFFITERLNF